MRCRNEAGREFVELGKQKSRVGCGGGKGESFWRVGTSSGVLPPQLTWLAVMAPSWRQTTLEGISALAVQ